MLRELEVLFNDEQLIKAIEEFGEYNKGGLSVKTNKGENGYSISVQYNSPLIEFQKYLNEMDNDLFVSTCEYLGDTRKIQKCLDSNDLESVRAGILKFKTAVSEVALNKIKQLEKYVRSYTANKDTSCER